MTFTRQPGSLILPLGTVKEWHPYGFPLYICNRIRENLITAGY